MKLMNEALVLPLRKFMYDRRPQHAAGAAKRNGHNGAAQIPALARHKDARGINVAFVHKGQRIFEPCFLLARSQMRKQQTKNRRQLIKVRVGHDVHSIRGARL